MPAGAAPPAAPPPRHAERLPRVLIVEDQERVAKALAVLLELEGFASVVARSPQAAVACLSAGGFDLVLQDMNFSAGATSGDEGRRLFDRIRAAHPGLPLILLTAWGQVEAAVGLMRAGAADYLEKPWDDAKLLASVRRALAGAHPAAEVRHQAGEPGDVAARARLAAEHDLCGLVYASRAMHEVVALAARVAASEVSVLITGESGTGKEKLAEILHANSPRRGRPLVRVDAGALPETLLEAELFGAEPGAFTGITRRRVGRFEAADGGSLLLDEIGNLPLAGQAKLLRVLQSGRLERLGSSQTLAVDVRVVAATNADLHRAIAAGTFREDLYYRLAVIEIEVPPLARRREDVLPLAAHFLAGVESRPGPPAALSDEARRALEEHDWPGNVRELEHWMESAVVLSKDGVVGAEDLPARRVAVARPGVAGGAVAASAAGAGVAGDAGVVGAGGSSADAVGISSELSLDEAVRAYVEAVLAKTGGNKAEAARRLKIGRNTLSRILKGGGLE